MEYEGRTAIWTAPSHSSSFLATLVQASSDHRCASCTADTLPCSESFPGNMVNGLRRVGFYR